MKIALICPYHVSRTGGVMECVKALQADYERRGHEAKIITPMPRDYKGPVPDSIITLGASMTTKSFVGSAWQVSASVDIDAIDEVLEREKFDVFHFHEPWIPFWSRQFLARTNGPRVATFHGAFYDSSRTWATASIPYTKPMIKYFDVFTAVAAPSLEYFRTLSKRPVVMIPNGIDIAKYQTPPSKLKRNSKTKTILYIGRLENRKGLKYLLRAYAELAKNHKDVQLLLAGSGPDTDKLKSMVKEKSIPHVSFLGYISEEDKIRYLHQADLFCAPSHYGESFGIVLLEAMSAGLPVVAGDNVGYVSVLKDRGLVSLVNPLDTVDFARRLELMLYDEQIRKMWIDWAKDYVKQFDYPIIAEQYLEVYKQAIAQHKNGKPQL